MILEAKEKKTELGIVGLGRIGGNLALQALEKGMCLVGSTRKGAPQDAVEALQLAGDQCVLLSGLKVIDDLFELLKRFEQVRHG